MVYCGLTGGNSKNHNGNDDNSNDDDDSAEVFLGVDDARLIKKLSLYLFEKRSLPIIGYVIKLQKFCLLYTYMYIK